MKAIFLLEKIGAVARSVTCSSLVRKDLGVEVCRPRLTNVLMAKLLLLTIIIGIQMPGVFAAAPVIVWKIRNMTTGAISGGLPDRFPVASTDYTVQASGYSDEGTLANVIVWKDGSYFAYDGGNNGYWNNSDPNTINDPAGTIHVFMAQAIASDGKKSPFIYWITKAGGSTLSYTDLETTGVPSLNPNGTGNPWLPNTGDFQANSDNFNEIIASLGGDHTSGKVLEFTDDEYLFNADVNGGLQSFQDVGNLEITGGPLGLSTLNWAIRDSQGLPYDPSIPAYNSSAYFTGIGSYNPQPVNPSHQPSALFLFDSDCDHIVVSNITFDTDYTCRIGGDGSHIKMNGSDMRVTNCSFYHATGFAVHVGGAGSGTVSSISVDASRFFYTWADGLHVSKSDGDIWLVGNSFYETGDDAMAVTQEGGTSTDVHVWSNYVHNTHWRGLLVWSASNVDIQDNYITGTARAGIEVKPQSDGVWANCIQLLENYVEYTGTMSGHNFDTPTNSEHGYRLDSIHNLHVDFTPRSDAPLHGGQQYAAFQVNGPQPSSGSYPSGGASGAYLTNLDNSPTTGTPYTYSVVHYGYLDYNPTDGGGGGYSNPTSIPSTY